MFVTALLFIAFAASGVAANYLVAYVGIIPIGFGLMAPAGVVVVGLALTLRDLLHERAPVPVVIAAIAVGAALSALFAPALALASGVAFLASELADLGVYAPLRKRRWVAALLASNAVGLVVDSVLFLSLAFGSLAFLPGQILGKLYGTVIAVALIALLRNRGVITGPRDRAPGDVALA